MIQLGFPLKSQQSVLDEVRGSGWIMKTPLVHFILSAINLSTLTIKFGLEKIFSQKLLVNFTINYKEAASNTLQCTAFYSR